MVEWASGSRPLHVRPAAVNGLIVLAGTLWFAVNLRWPIDPHLGWLLIPVAAGVSMVAVLPILRSTELPPAGRRFWRLITLGFPPIAVGYLVRMYATATGMRTGPTDIAPAEMLCYLVTVVIVTVALFRLPLGLNNPLHRVTFVLDICVVLVAAVLILWEFTSRPVRDHPTGGGTGMWLSLLGATLGMVAVLGLAKISMARAGVVDRCALRLLGIAVLVGVAGSAPDALLAPYTELSATQLAVPAAAWLFSLAAHRQAANPTNGGPGVFERRGRGPRRHPFSVVPYLAVLVVLALLMVASSWTDRGERLTVAAAAVLVMLLVMIRQLVSFQENRQLMLSLDAGMSELRDHERRFRSLVQHASDLITITDEAGMLSYVSPGVTQMLGAGAEHWVGKPARDLIHPDDLPLTRERYSQIAGTPGAIGTFQARLAHADGSWRWTDVTITNLLHDPGVRGIVSNARDVTEAREFQQRLRYQASHDGLTGLVNRTFFADRLGRAVDGTQHRPVSVILVDLNEFKAVNDAYGHAVGDAVLAAAADRLRRGARPGDTVARLGGDEFALLLPDTDAADAEVVVDSIVRGFDTPARVGGRTLPLAASLGVATCLPGTPPDEVLRRADVAMYAAKADRAAGQVRSVPYTPAIDVSLVTAPSGDG